jgi:hypothetical protein
MASALLDLPLQPEPITGPPGTPVAAPAPLNLDLDRALAFGPIGDPTPPPGLFDYLFSTLTVPAAPNRPLPPPDRFRVRVAHVSRPNRVTKRDYNYFEELDTALAARAKRVDPSES